MRGAGSFIGETAVYESKANAVWETCVGAKGPVKVLVLKFRDLMDLVSKRPEVEADIRAGGKTPNPISLGKLTTPPNLMLNVAKHGSVI